MRRVPIADGGEGTVAAAVAAGFTPMPARVTGPTGHPVAATIAIRAGVAVLESASACGLALLPEGRPAPLTATSIGVGELIRIALDAGATTIVLGVGGSASTDGGAGLATALGARLTDTHGAPLPPGGGALTDLAKVDLIGLDPRLATADVIVAGDVDNPLLGPKGAATVFGPQKGANPAQVVRLETGLRIWSALVGPDLTGEAGAGAAGGIGFAARAVLGAIRRSGIDLMLELVDFPDQLPGAALVITGEGSLDAQSLHGKAPIGVVEAARRAGVPAVVVAGRCELDAPTLAAAGIAAAYALTDIEPDPARCIADAAPLLERLAGSIAWDWLP